MGDSFENSRGKPVVEGLIHTIHEHRAYLSEIDGAIGDGDHGINMDKGFQLVAQKIADRDMGLSEALNILGRTLVEEIGGSMGPLYGRFFMRMAKTSRDQSTINGELFGAMLRSAYEGIQSLGGAQVGDKTLVDSLDPAMKAFEGALASGQSFAASIDGMIAAAEKGWASTKDLVARIGRAARLGERSRGSVDAGATSCYLMLKSMGTTMKELCA